MAGQYWPRPNKELTDRPTGPATAHHIASAAPPIEAIAIDRGREKGRTKKIRGRRGRRREEEGQEERKKKREVKGERKRKEGRRKEKTREYQRPPHPPLNQHKLTQNEPKPLRNQPPKQAAKKLYFYEGKQTCARSKCETVENL